MVRGKNINVTQRVTARSGWAAMLGGESQGKAVERDIVRLNDAGYRLVFVIPDKWNIFRHLLNIIVTICTLGFVSRSPGVLLIGENVSVLEPPAAD